MGMPLGESHRDFEDVRFDASWACRPCWVFRTCSTQYSWLVQGMELIDEESNAMSLKERLFSASSWEYVPHASKLKSVASVAAPVHENLYLRPQHSDGNC